MAKHPHEGKSPKNQPDPDDVVDLGGHEAEPDSPKKTQISKQSAQPTQLGKKSPQHTQIAKKSAQPTQMARDEDEELRGPDTPPKVPNMELEDVAEAEEAEEVLDVQPASDVQAPGSGAIEVMPLDEMDEALPAEDDEVLADDVLEHGSESRREAESPPALEAHPASDVVEAGETPSGRSIADDIVAEDIFAEPASGVKPESDIHREAARRAPPEDLEVTEAFDAASDSSSDFDKTVHFETDDESAVDLGKHHKKGSSSQMGVDPVAEALESGVDLEAAPSATRKKKPTPSVEFDDLIEDEPKAKKRTKHDDQTDLDQAALEAEDIAAADLLSDDDTEVAGSVDDEAAALFASEDDAVSAEPADEAEVAEAAEAEEEEERPKKKKKKSRRDDDDELVGAGVGRSGKPVKPKYGRRWLGGMLLGMLLLAGGAGAVWYFVPEYLDLIPPSPNAPKKIAQPVQPAAPTLSLAQRAQAEIDEKNYDAALEMLKDIPDDKEKPALLSTRAEARWLKYLNQQAAQKAPLNPADPEVKAALADLDAANNMLLKDQYVKTLQHPQLSQQVAQLQGSQQTLLELQNLLSKAKFVGENPDPAELPKALSQTIDSKAQADALIAEIQKAMVAAKHLDAKDPVNVAAVQKIIKDASVSQATVEAVNKLLAEAELKETGAKGVAALTARGKQLQETLDAVNKALAGEKVKATDAKGVQELIAARDRLQKERDELEKAIRTAYQELVDGKLAKAEDDPRKGLSSAVKNARNRSESPLAIPLSQITGTFGMLGTGIGKAIQGAFETTALTAELSYYRLREPLIQAPEAKLDSYIALYQDRRFVAADQALRDAAWVLSPNAKATPEVQAKAHYVVGLVQRNQQKFGEAKKSLQTAVATASKLPDAGPWVKNAQENLKELTDPAAYWLPKVEQLTDVGANKAALAEIGTALKALPDEPHLLAQRALVKLDNARGQGKAIPAEVQQSIRADADAVLKNPKTQAEGAYILGLLEEELGRYSQAEKHFRQALKSAEDAVKASRYRIALARVLLQDPTPVFAPPEPEKAAPAKTVPDKNNDAAPKKDAEKKTGPKVDMSRQYFPLVAAFVIGQVDIDDENPVTAGRIQESIKLAEELIKSEDRKVRGQGHLLLGQAYSRQGKRTEGLREYMKGIALLYPGLATQDMTQLLQEHPAFQQPDVASRPNAYLAETHFGKGLHHYWSSRYPEAEHHFKQAVEFYGQDARYQYFLGLAQSTQRTQAKRDAAFYSSEQGARPEAANRPPTSEINASLERVQGDLRRLINHFRNKALEVSAE